MTRVCQDRFHHGLLGDDCLGDIFASAEYRKAVTPHYVQQAISSAAERA